MNAIIVYKQTYTNGKDCSILQVCAVVISYTIPSLNFYTSVSGCGCGFGFEQKYWRINRFGQKKAQIGIPLFTPLFQETVVTKKTKL